MGSSKKPEALEPLKVIWFIYLELYRIADEKLLVGTSSVKATERSLLSPGLFISGIVSILSSEFNRFGCLSVKPDIPAIVSSKPSSTRLSSICFSLLACSG